MTLVVDNFRRWYTALTDAATTAVLEDMGTPALGRDEYEAMLRGGDRRDEYVRAVGLAVVAQLTEMIGEWAYDRHVEGMVPVMILIDLLDLGDSTQADMFGEHYLPEDADDIPWP